MPRRSLLYPVMCSLALVTALAMLRAAALIDGAAAVDAAAGNPLAAVRAFYDAANVVLASGDVSALDAVVAPDFVVDAPAPGMTPDRAGLAAYLSAIHATVPNAQLIVEDVTAVGDLAMARVAISGDHRSGFLGLPLSDEPPIWGTSDAFRIASGRVVELIGGAHRPLLLETLGRLSLGTRLTTRGNVALERWTVAPGASPVTQTAGGWRMMYLTAGDLTIALDSTSPDAARRVPALGSGAVSEEQPVTPGDDTRLVLGESVSLPVGSRYTLRNDGPGPAEALVVKALIPDVGDSSMLRGDPAYASAGGAEQRVATAADGFRVEPLAGGLTTAFPAREAAVAIGRATLAPGAAVAFAAGEGPALLSVATGTLGLEATGGTAWVRRAVNGGSSDVTGGLLAAGDGALVAAGTPLSLRNPYAEPVVVFVVTIAPDDRDASSGVGSDDETR